jgi:tRNA U34 2-thiouridine synthase MnmA/TrmU
MPDPADKLTACFTSGKKVLAGLTGDIFSALSAWAAKQAGAVVEGVTLRLTDGDDALISKAEKTANQLKINWSVSDYRKFFGEDVLSGYIGALKSGIACSPCALCNGKGKTAYLFAEMQRVSAENFVTGDIARIAAWKEGRAVFKAKNSLDDSGAFTFTDPFHLSFMITPLGEAESRRDIENLAKRAGLTGEPERRKKPCFLNSGLTENILKSIPYKKERANKARIIRLRDTVFRHDEPPVSRVTVALSRYKRVGALLEIFFGNSASLLTDIECPIPPGGEALALYCGDRLIGGGIVDS